MDALNGRAKWTSMLLKMQELTFNSIPFIMTAKLKAIRADLTELLPVPRLLERRLHALYAFRQWAVAGKSSQIADVTVSRTRCAITPTKGHTITPEEGRAIGVFMQEVYSTGRKCGKSLEGR